MVLPIYDFTDEHVRQSIELSHDGQQRLHPVSSSETTLFYISTSDNGHYGVAQVSIGPIRREDGRNPFYLPILRHTQCCTNAPQDLFKYQYQLVYNVFIRPIQWIFGDDMYARILPALVNLANQL